MGYAYRYLECVTISIINNCFNFVPNLIDAICPK